MSSMNYRWRGKERAEFGGSPRISDERSARTTDGRQLSDGRWRGVFFGYDDTRLRPSHKASAWSIIRSYNHMYAL